MAPQFDFHEVWRLPAAPDRVYQALAAPADYERWWPQILKSDRIDDDSGILVCRSRLPYTLRMGVRRQVEDPVARYLRAGLTGDLVGWSSWLVEPDGPGGSVGSRAVYDQVVTVSGRLLNAAAVVAGPLLRWNHHAMMAGGERGLQRYLAL